MIGINKEHDFGQKTGNKFLVNYLTTAPIFQINF